MAEQHKGEQEWLLRQIAGSESILEIGSRLGGNLSDMASVCKPGARIYSIDIGIDDKGNHTADLMGTIESLNAKGYKAEALISDSTSPPAIAWAKQRAPFDLLFIDGDHTAHYVRADWSNYGPLAKRVGFHDIDAEDLGVRALWNELKQSHQTTEISLPGNSHMGIGIADNG